MLLVNIRQSYSACEYVILTQAMPSCLERIKAKRFRPVKRPQKVRQVFVVQVVQAAEEVCCLRKADGNPFGFALMRQLL